MSRLDDLFDLSGRVCVITGGLGLLGVRHAIAISNAGGSVVLVDIKSDRAEEVCSQIRSISGVNPHFVEADIADEPSVLGIREFVASEFGRLDILVNNAARNPAVDESGMSGSNRLETLPVSVWNSDIAVSLTGAFLCSRVLGGMLQASKHGGVILNISSDLGVIAPNQTLYRREGVSSNDQQVKPVSYSVAKAGLIGLTRYLATYWENGTVRANALCPGGVFTDQSPEFLARFADLVPMRRMANVDEYEGAVVFMVSDASRYMNGAVVSIDGGRTAW